LNKLNSLQRKEARHFRAKQNSKGEDLVLVKSLYHSNNSNIPDDSSQGTEKIDREIYYI